MRKVKFLSGLNATLVLAAVLVAGFTFTSCEEEDLSVTTTSGTSGSSTVTVNGYDLEDGVVYLTLSTTNTLGQELTDVTYTRVDGADLEYYFTAEEEFELVADKDGFISSQKTISIPEPVEGTLVIYNANFVLTTLDEQEVYATELEAVDASAAVDGETVSTTDTDTHSAGSTVTIEFPYGDAVPYVTADQIAAWEAAIDEACPTTESASTRGATAEARANEIMKAFLATLPTEPGEETLEITVTIASDVTVTSIVVEGVEQIVNVPYSITANVDGDDYTVEGYMTVVVGVNDVTSTLTGAYHNGHAYTHSHNHSDDSNSGGGTAGE